MEVSPSSSSPAPADFGVEPSDVSCKILQIASSDEILCSSSYGGIQNDASPSAIKISEPELQDLHYCDEANEDLYFEDEEYEIDYEFEYDYDIKLSAKFDEMDIPTGVEVNVPWLQQKSSRELYIKQCPEIAFEIDEKFKSFKQFDIVGDFSDHHFSASNSNKPAKDWVKCIQNEWKLLENDLPEAIFVRVYEGRMDLLRAVIVGAAGTPYHDGLFFFDAHFPPNYPQSPPVLYYHSGGLRLNPNLYNNGMVCLSLLGTWSGSGCEMWDPSKSTMLQVLISIQALILNENPYFNEPGFEISAHTTDGKKQALLYNENTFLLSCKTMLYSLKSSPKHFEDFVSGHFRKQGHAILAACKAYLHGAQIGSNTPYDEVPDDGKITTFKEKLKILFENLLMEFTVKGADCDKFLEQKKKAQESTSKGT